MLEDQEKIEKIFHEFNPDVVVHLAAQAGVGIVLENPRSYIDSNIVGTFNIMELAKKYKVKHLLMASTSSVYGSNNDMPFKEISKSDNQLTIYAATKKLMSLWRILMHIFGKYQLLCFVFTVYGPWGRPDMALFKFVSAILNEKPINIL